MLTALQPLATTATARADERQSKKSESRRDRASWRLPEAAKIAV
jgi:hypothetical protein